MQKKAVVLLSGGLDSAVTLYIAKKNGYDCRCLIFDYGQRHRKEIEQAKKIAETSGSGYEVFKLSFSWKGSSLVDKKEHLPLGRTAKEIKAGGIPSTYVPGRNTIFLSVASSYAEAMGAGVIFIGAHYEDSSGYPDCRREYLEAFDRVLASGTKAGLEGRLKLEYPLIKKTKAQIIKTGISLGVPLNLTWSCYAGGARPCGKCDSCVLRAKGFKEAGTGDPLAGTQETPKAIVTEIFSSMQGEGVFTGSRQIFIRFKKCNMECGFCDTPNNSSGKEYSPAQLVLEIRALDKKKWPHHSISLTGGEPLIYSDFLKKLLPSLKELGFKTYLETNGTLPEKLRGIIDFVDIIAMDFKLPSSTRERPYWGEHLEFLKIASAKKVFVKAVVTSETRNSDIEQAVEWIRKINVKIPLIIQPATPVKKADKVIPESRLREFSELAIKSGIKDSRIMPQIHKILGVK